MAERPDLTPPEFPPEQLAELFPPTREKPLKDGAFEIGLCLGGTISAGAYTAGVLDCFIEALDAWTAAKERGEDVPKHEVVISTLAGASGGAINAAIFARAAGYAYPYGSAADNPFFSTWYGGITLLEMLKVPDSEEPPLASLLNCEVLRSKAKSAVGYSGAKLGTKVTPRQRSYLADPMRFFMTLGNLNGIPYAIDLGGSTGLTHQMQAHGDYVRFALAVEGGIANAPQTRPDEFALNPLSDGNWPLVAQAALATSAFPLAFRPREVRRPLDFAGYRAVAVPNGNGGADVIQLIPNWKVLAGNLTNNPDTLVSVDGGTFNNEPLDLVRMSLAGLAGRNKRRPGEVDRAVILIDPFSDPEPLLDRHVASLPDMIIPLFNALIAQARYKPEDLALAQDEDVYSRYLVAPVGPDLADFSEPASGSRAIASGGVGGFLGFIDPSFMAYDFDLGRCNAHAFLKKHLAIPEAANNPLFSGTWSNAHKMTYGHVDASGARSLPLIPLMKSLQDDPPQLRAPSNLKRGLPEGLSEALERRLDYLYDQAKSQFMPSGWIKRVLGSLLVGALWNGGARNMIRDEILKKLKKALDGRKLL